MNRDGLYQHEVRMMEMKQMKPKKLTYNEVTDTFSIHSEGVEGALRPIIGSATEEWVIAAILNQNAINNDLDGLNQLREELNKLGEPAYCCT